MKTTVSILFAAALALSSIPAHAVVLDLSTMTCKQFVDGGDDTIKMVLTWMDGWYKGDSDEAIIDTDVFVENAKKFGTYCGKNPTMSIVNAAESVLGKWHGTKYRFIQRYRSGFPENLGEEFDAPFARLDWISRNRFDLQWHRHTGEWFCLHRGLTLAEAIDALRSDGLFHPF